MLVELVLCPLTLAGGAFGPIIAKLIFLLQKICKPNSSVKCFLDEIVRFKAIEYVRGGHVGGENNKNIFA